MFKKVLEVRPHNLDEYFKCLLKNIYKHRNLSVEVNITFYIIINYVNM